MKRDTIADYLALQRDPVYANYFRQSGTLPLVLEEKTLRDWSRKHDQPLGLVFDNSPFYLVLRDLVAPSGKPPFAYARVIHTGGKAGAVILPVYRGRAALLRHYRHASRDSVWELPRGFMSPGEPLSGTAARELWEELGADPEKTAFTLLGQVQADSGIIAARAEVYLAELSMAPTERPADPTEGIQRVRWADRAALRDMCAAGEIVDGFTLSSLTLWTAAEAR